MEQIKNAEQLQKRINGKSFEELKMELRKLKKKQGLLVYDKHHYERVKDYEKVVEVRKALKEVKRMKNVVEWELNSFFPTPDKQESKKNIPIYLRRKVSSLRNLESLSHLLGEEMESKIKRLEENCTSSEKLQILAEVIPFCEQTYAHLMAQKELYQELATSLGIKVGKSMKKEINNRVKTLTGPEQLKLDYYKETALQVSCVLESLYTLKGIYGIAHVKEEKGQNRKMQDIFLDNDEEIILSNIPPFLTNDISFQKNLDCFLKEDIFEEFDKVCASLNELTKQILDSISTLECEKAVCLCNIMKNRTISKINELKSYLPKEEAKSYIVELKKVIKCYEKTKKTFFEKKTKENKRDPYYDIFIILLQNQKNYYYVEKVLETVESELSESTIKKLVEQVLDLFVKNHKLKIESQKLCEIEPSYYFRILTLFQKKNFISKELYEIFKKRMEELTKYACSKQPSKNRDMALNHIESLTNGIGVIDRTEEMESIEVKRTVQERLQYINTYNGVKRDENYPTRTFALGNLAYSIQYNKEGNMYFRVHLLDTNSLIFEDTKANEIVKKHMFLNRKVPFSFSYKKGVIYPALTFQYRIYNNNTSRLKIYTENILIDEVYKQNDLKNYRDLPDLKAFVSSYKKIWKIDAIDAIQTRIERSICEEIMTLLKGCVKEVPCMYKQSLKRNMESAKIENALTLGPLLYKIDKKIAHKICGILKEDIPPIYTSTITSDTYLELHPFAYDTICLYRTVKQVLNETFNFNKDYADYKNEMEAYCQAYNERYSYLDATLLEEKKKKVKKN